MIALLRQTLNQSFSQKQYQAFLADFEASVGHKIKFRIAETPVFVDAALKKQLLEACESLFDTILEPDFKAKTEGSLPKDFVVGGDEGKPLFLQVDFGICRLADGTLAPRLIEIQGFPSLYFYQAELAAAYRRHFPVPAEMKNYVNGYNRNTYIDILNEVIVAGHNPEEVVLLEVDIPKQSTNVDFFATARALGIHVLDLADMKREGRNLYYIKDGRRVPIKRIYNRVIFDELEKYADRPFEYRFNEEVDVEWAAHPNWFFRISKYTLPLFNSPYVPKTYFLHELKEIPANLDQFVLKPLFSFAGLGVVINVTPEDISNIPEDQKSGYILQEKVNYAPVIETEDVAAKCEIRMMAVWKPGADRPEVIGNICRMSKGEMVGVRYNADKTWVGGTVCFFE
jgi:hypothetical protein